MSFIDVKEDTECMWRRLIVLCFIFLKLNGQLFFVIQLKVIFWFELKFKWKMGFIRCKAVDLLLSLHLHRFNFLFIFFWFDHDSMTLFTVNCKF